MSVQEIEAAIAALPPQDLAQLVRWLQEFHAAAWDKQIEEDLQSGRLDSLLADVNAEHKAGLSRPL